MFWRQQLEHTERFVLCLFLRRKSHDDVLMN